MKINSHYHKQGGYFIVTEYWFKDSTNHSHTNTHTQTLSLRVHWSALPF